MTRLRILAAAALLWIGFAAHDEAHAQAAVSMYCFNPTGSNATNNQFVPCQSSNPLQIAGSLSIAGSTSNASSGVATSSTNLPTVSYNYGFNGTTWDQLQVDGSKNLKVNVVTGGGGSQTDQSAWTQGSTSMAPAGCAFNNAATLTSGQQGTVRCNGNRAQIVDVDTSSSNLYTALTSAIPVNKNGTNTGATGSTPGTAQTGTQVNQDMTVNAVSNTALANYGSAPGSVPALPVNAAVTQTVATPAGTNVIGFTSNDPCAQATKLGGVISLTASGQIITGTASKKTYICAINLVSATAQNIALVEGTGSTCATNIFGLAGGTTAATGWNFSANGGLTLGGGNGTVISPSADTNGTAANVCLLLSSTGQTSGQLSYVQQ